MTQPLSADQLLAERAVVTLREYGALLGMSAGAVRARADRGRLGVPVVQLVPHGARFIRTQDIRDLLSRTTGLNTTEGGDAACSRPPVRPDCKAGAKERGRPRKTPPDRPAEHTTRDRPNRTPAPRGDRPDMITDPDRRTLFFHDQCDLPVLRCVEGGEADLARAAVASASTARVRRISSTALEVSYSDGMDPHRRLTARGFRVRQDPSIPYHQEVPIERSYRQDIRIPGYEPVSTLESDSEAVVTVHSRDALPLQLTMADDTPFVAVRVLGVLSDEGFLVTDEADDDRPGMAFGDLWLQARGTSEELQAVLAAHGIAAAVADNTCPTAPEETP